MEADGVLKRQTNHMFVVKRKLRSAGVLLAHGNERSDLGQTGRWRSVRAEHHAQNGPDANNNGSVSVRQVQRTRTTDVLSLFLCSAFWRGWESYGARLCYLRTLAAYSGARRRRPFSLQDRYFFMAVFCAVRAGLICP